MPIEIVIPLGVLLLGAVIGSFLNVCIYRMPRRESLVFPGSHCPQCQAAIRFYDNIPIISWFLLAGKCRHCKQSISFQYPLVEALNAAGYVYLYSRFGLSPQMVLYALFFSALVVITFIDLHHKIIPDLISLPGIAVGLAASVLFQFYHPSSLQGFPPGFVNALLGAALGYALFYLIAVGSRAILKQDGMGGGDIKLIAMIGAFLGWKMMFLTIMLGAFSGSIVGISLMVFFGKGRRYAVPFGPFLALGAMVSLFWGPALWVWYRNLLVV
jgi:leader peptidase (prepilin peptidase)/N-methyltransferase